MRLLLSSSRVQDAEHFESRKKKKGGDPTFSSPASRAALAPDDSLLTQSLQDINGTNGHGIGNGVDTITPSATPGLVSTEATMMSKEQRDLIASGTPEGLEAYKDRMYRKMEAYSPEEVRLSSLLLLCCQHVNCAFAGLVC